MKDKKKSFRKELKQSDEFITFWMRAFTFSSKHKRELTMGLAGALVIVLVVLVTIAYFKKKDERAENIFIQAQALLFPSPTEEVSIQVEKASVADPADRKKAVSMLQELVDHYRGTYSAQMGRLLLGHIYYEQGDFPDAIKMYKDFLDRKNVPEGLLATAWEGLAYAQEANGDFTGAIHSFQELTHMNQPYMIAWAWMGMARCYEQTGEKEKALEAYRNFLADNPQHNKAEEARAGMAKIAQQIPAQHEEKAAPVDNRTPVDPLEKDGGA